MFWWPCSSSQPDRPVPWKATVPGSSIMCVEVCFTRDPNAGDSTHFRAFLPLNICPVCSSRLQFFSLRAFVIRWPVSNCAWRLNVLQCVLLQQTGRGTKPMGNQTKLSLCVPFLNPHQRRCLSTQWSPWAGTPLEQVSKFILLQNGGKVLYPWLGRQLGLLEKGLCMLLGACCALCVVLYTLASSVVRSLSAVCTSPAAVALRSVYFEARLRHLPFLNARGHHSHPGLEDEAVSSMRCVGDDIMP